MQESATSLPSHRRWLRFSLRTLLIVVIVAAVFSQRYASSLQQGPDQQTAAAEIRRRGGTAMECPHYPSLREVEACFPYWISDKFGPDCFACINYVSINEAKFTDEDLALLESLPNLHALFLTKSQITDAGLPQLTKLPLQQLSLAKTRLTDAGLVSLDKLTQLESLDLSGTAITDAGLKPLQSLKNLRRLNLTDTQVTDAGVAALIQVLPSLKVTRGVSPP